MNQYKGGKAETERNPTIDFSNGPDLVLNLIDKLSKFGHRRTTGHNTRR